MTERIEKTAAFVRRKLAESPYFDKHPEAGEYRLEHTFRVARIGREIAEREGFSVENMTLACLLHDVSYCREFRDHQDWLDHGREAARIARPFLAELGLAGADVEEICTGIAIHVDDRADFPCEATLLARTVGDADNIDRFDVYRLYETLESAKFSAMPLAEKTAYVEDVLIKLESHLAAEFATGTATALWRERVGFYLDFYRRLKKQLEASVWGAAAPASGGMGTVQAGTFLELAGRM